MVGHKGRVVFQKAYGNRALVPRREPMTLDTIFDVASLTKVVATTSAIAKLVEEGKIRLNEKVTEYIPEFQGGKSEITVRNLLTHFSGMRPDVDLEPVWSGYEHGNSNSPQWTMPIESSEYLVLSYSDINFVLLGEIVQRVSGKTLPEYVQAKIFRPLGMSETMYLPPNRCVPRIAPTEIVKGSLNSSSRRGARSHGSVHGRGRRTCRTILDCGGFVEIRRDAARHGTAKGRSHLQPVDGAEVYQSAGTRRPADSSRARMGY